MHGLEPSLRDLVRLTRVLAVINVYLRLETHTTQTIAAAEAQIVCLSEVIKVSTI
jgi:hypothetical protein